jgi:carbonic anhydrase
MQKLVEGLHRFQSELFGSHRALFERLAKEQRPEVLFITCSDSRISLNLITQTQPGDLFILRNAGNIIPPHGASNGGEAATIEFAVAGLGVRHIIVCGHSHCGAMKALHKPEDLTELPALRSWLNNAEATRQIIRDNYKHLEGDALVTATVEENVLVQLENLRTHPIVLSRLSRGTLQLYGWVYKIETGQVFQYESESGQFLSVTDHPPAPIPVPRHAAHPAI